MRIIAGLHKGRTLSAPLGKTTRPTAERVRQALFDTLMHAPWGGRALFEGCHVLDAFAGTGALGLEALSRGAQYASFFETNPLALSHLRANIRSCRAESACCILAQDVTKPPLKLPRHVHTPASLIFLDPPYYSDLSPYTLYALFVRGWISPHAIAVIESAHDEILSFEKISVPAFSHRITKNTPQKSTLQKLHPKDFPEKENPQKYRYIQKQFFQRMPQENSKTLPKKQVQQMQPVQQETLFSLPLSLLTTRQHGAAYLSFWQFTS